MTGLETSIAEKLDSAEQIAGADTSVSRDSQLPNDAALSNKLGTSNQPQVVPLSLRKAKVKQTELILFTTQLSVMLDSGVVLSDALDAIAKSTLGRKQWIFRMIIMDVSEMVKSCSVRAEFLWAYRCPSSARY